MVGCQERNVPLLEFTESTDVQEQQQQQTLTAEYNLFLIKYLCVQLYTRNKITLLYIPYDINKHMIMLRNINCDTRMIKYVSQPCNCNIITARRPNHDHGQKNTDVCLPSPTADAGPSNR